MASHTPLVFHPIYSQLELPERHRFPIEKYQAIYDRLVLQSVDKNTFYQPEALTFQQVSAHLCHDYLNGLTTGTLDGKAMRRIGFPWSEQLVKRTLTASAGTILTAIKALESGKALNLTGGYHHAFYDFGSGFCMVNDLYLAAHKMLEHQGIDRVLIFDCDVHQGDGTAALATDNESIITVSLHCEKNFPYRKQHSDMDFPLDKHLKDDEYLTTVEQAFNLAVNTYQPDAVIYDAGVDIHIDDDLGLLDITTDGVYQRDSFVFNRCDEFGLPVAAVIGGGYQRDINALVDVHIQLFKAAGIVE